MKEEEWAECEWKEQPVFLRDPPTFLTLFPQSSFISSLFSGPGFGASLHHNGSLRDFTLLCLSQGEILVLSSPPAESKVTMIRANGSMTTIFFFFVGPGNPTQRWYSTHHTAGIRLPRSFWRLEKENPSSI